MKKKKVLLIIIAALLAAALIAGICYLFFVHLPERKRMREGKEFAAAMAAYYDAKNESFVDENPTKVGVDVAFIGDSLTDGYDVARYYPEFATANRGIGGDTTFGVEKRLQTSLFDIQPHVVVMMIGTNNLDTMFENYEDILVKLCDNLPNSEIVLLSIPPTAGAYKERNGRIAFNNVKIRALAEKYGYTYVDIHTLLLDHEKDVLRAAYTSDDLHFTHEGYVVITNAVKPVLTDLLENAK